MKGSVLPSKLVFVLRIFFAPVLLFLIAKSLFFMVRGFHAGNAIAAVSGLLSAVFFGIIFALMTVPSFIGNVAERLSCSIFHPVRKLDAPPVMLSPVQGMIRDGRIREAEETLLSLRNAYPFDGRIVFMLADLRINRLRDPGSAAELIEEFFASKGRKTGDPVSLLLRHGDCCLALRDPQRSVALIEKEIDSCDPAQRRSLENRLFNLKEKQNGIS